MVSPIPTKWRALSRDFENPRVLGSIPRPATKYLKPPPGGFFHVRGSFGNNEHPVCW